MKLYEVSDKYIKYLSKYEHKVLSNHEDDRNFNRPYLSGIIIKQSSFNYFIPLSSPDCADYDEENNVRRSTLTIKRIIVDNNFLGNY